MLLSFLQTFDGIFFLSLTGYEHK